jgi:hypothetical protein
VTATDTAQARASAHLTEQRLTAIRGFIDREHHNVNGYCARCRHTDGQRWAHPCPTRQVVLDELPGGTP